MKKMSYKKGGAKKKKKYTIGGPTGSSSTSGSSSITGSSAPPSSGYGPMRQFYKSVDSKLDDLLPGRQKRQDMRAERKDLRQAVRQEKALKRIESGRKMKAGGSVQWTRNNSRGRGRCM